MNVLGKGVYFLFKGEQLVYIGKSTRCIYSRIAKHCEDQGKDFDSWEYREKSGYTDQDIGFLETDLISYFNPPLNVMHSSKYGSRCRTKKGYMKVVDRIIRSSDAEMKGLPKGYQCKCKDCAFYRMETLPGYWGKNRRRACPFERQPDEDDFCSRGMRIEEWTSAER